MIMLLVLLVLLLALEMGGPFFHAHTAFASFPRRALFFTTATNAGITNRAEECITDRCSRYPCQHGGKCLPSDDGAICLCPLGFGGDLCEMRLDLQVRD